MITAFKDLIQTPPLVHKTSSPLPALTNNLTSTQMNGRSIKKPTMFGDEMQAE